MYKIVLDEGVVIRVSDNKVIAPCQSADDVDFVEYIQWVESGNNPEIIETRG